MKNHLKKLAAPKTWPIKRRDNKFITRPLPGPHKFNLGTSIDTLFKTLLNYGSTSREVRNILNTKNVLIDGIRRKEPKFIVGLFDTIAIDDIGSYYRILLNKRGKLSHIPIKKEESRLKLCKIVGKTVLKKNKIQLNLFDGKNILVDKDSYKTGDSVLLSLPDNKIKKHVKLDKKISVFLTGGKHIGEIGTIQGIMGDKIIFRNQKGDNMETLKEHAFVIGEDKPLISLE